MENILAQNFPAANRKYRKNTEIAFRRPVSPGKSAPEYAPWKPPPSSVCHTDCRARSRQYYHFNNKLSTVR
jgi:hypothetical protein